MKPRIKGLILFFIFIISIFSICAYAKIRQVPETGEISRLPAWLESQIRQMQANEQLMQKKIKKLEAELRARPGQIPPPAVQSGQNGTSASTGSTYVNPITGSIVQQQPESARQIAAEQSVYLGESQGYFGIRRFAQGITVTTSPLLGVRSAFDASDLLYQYPSMNEDLVLLRQRGFFEEHLAQIGDTLDNRAIVVLSGGLQSQIVYNRNFTGYADGDINLTSAELDVTPMVGAWTNGFVALSFDSASAATGNRVENSRIYLSRGFITFGNLEKVPLYVTVGQMYLPFGKYSSAMLSTPMTQSIARIQDRAALIGLYRHGFYGELYGYQGNRTTGTQFTFKQGGINAGYQASNIDFGMGYVTNIADSQGMQNNGVNSILADLNTTSSILTVILNEFGGFGETIDGNQLVHNVGAADGHIEFFYGPFSVIAEYITTTQQFDPTDMTFNGSPANVKALHCETDFTMHVHDKPIVLGMIFEQSWDSLALNLPQNSYVMVINTSFFKNTSFGIEYRHDVNYAITPIDATDGAELPVPSANIGGTRNLVTIQFGAYF